MRLLPALTPPPDLGGRPQQGGGIAQQHREPAAVGQAVLGDALHGDGLTPVAGQLAKTATDAAGRLML